MFKKGLNLRNVATIVACLAVCAVISCGGKDKDKDGDDDGENAKGQVELNGKKYPLHESTVIVNGSNYVLNFSSKNTGGAQFDINTSAGSELPAGTYTLADFNLSPILSVADPAVDIVLFIRDDPASLVVKKSGSDYEITFTCKVWLEVSNNAPKHDYKLTYKGKIQTIKL